MHNLFLARSVLALLLAMSALNLAGCETEDESNDKNIEAYEAEDNGASAQSVRPTFPATAAPKVTTFLYQLQDLDLAAAAATGYELIIMDYSATGEDSEAYTPTQLAALKNGSGGPKILLAYLSIGEAESYRSYWNAAWDEDEDGEPDAAAPGWLDVVNPDWEGNYKVHYWDPGWQAIIFGRSDSYLAKIMAVGFDGVYLDIIDSYSYYEEQGRETAARDMVDFVISLADYARARQPGFLVFPQNAAELAVYFPGYLAAVDGLGQEDLYFGYDGDGQPTPQDETNALEQVLDRYVAAGKTVLLTAYTTDRAQVDDHYARARARGYIPFATVRDLDQLTINPGHEP